MRLLDPEMIEHRENIVGLAVLAVLEAAPLRHIRRRITARGIGDGAG